MRKLLSLLALAPLLWAAPALAKTPRQVAFHQAFQRMDLHWPNASSHDYWVALRDAEDLAKELTPEERASDIDVVKDFRFFDVYRRCWTALQAKEKAMSEFMVGELIMADSPDNLDGAREHYAAAAASWDEAFRLWPYLPREKVRGTDVKQSPVIAPGANWRAITQQRLDSLSPR